jgi:DnaK suppressor protein
MSAILSPAAGVAAPAGPANVREMLEGHEVACLRSRAEVMAAIAEDGLDPVLAARGESLQHTLEDIRAALARLEAGTYGRCVTCGSPIPAARLELRPFAATCVPCAGAAR